MTGPRPTQRAQAGFVLANTLILIAALSLVAVQVLKDSERRRRSLAAAQVAGQLDMLGDAGVALAAILLEKDFRANRFDHPHEAWMLDRHVVESEWGSVRVTVRDLQARLNVNLVALDGTGAAAAALAGFLDAAGIPPERAKAILGTFETPRAAGAGIAGRAGSDTFESKDIVWLGDFASIADADRAALARLRPQLSALPRGRGINVNTAGPEILAAVLNDRPELAATVLAARERQPFEDIATFREFVAGPANDGTSLPLQALAVQSFWFEVTTEAKIGSDVRRMRTTLVRDTTTGTMRIFAKSRPAAP